MDKEKAEKILKKIIDICDKEDIWFTIEKRHKPKLRDIVLTISLKIK